MCWNPKQNIVRFVWRRQSMRGGFTLVELLIVVVILSIAAAIVVPMASSAGTMQLRSAVNMVASDLEYAKSLAIGTGRRHSVVFDATAESYEILDYNDTPIQHPVTKQPRYVVNFRTDGRLGQVDIASVSFDGATAVSFDYLGSPYSGSSGVPSALNSGVITLQVGGATRTVSVEPVTGFVSISN